MYRNTEELDRFLDGGGTLVVASRQRSAAVRLAHAAAHCAAGHRVWPSPDVLPWSAWLQRQADAGISPGGTRQRRLSSLEDWLLWRDAVREAAVATSVLLPDSLLETVQRSSLLLDDWAIRLSSAAHDETALLLRARLGYQRRREALAALDHDQWRRDRGPFVTPLWFAGFDNMGAATARLLRERGARVDQGGEADEPVAAVQVRVCADQDQELELIALWCREQLAADPGARLLVVVPHLDQCEPQLRRRLSHALQSRELLSGSAAAPGFAIEGGVPLVSYPPVRSALSLLALIGNVLPFGEFAYLWRSSYLHLGPRDACLQLELWLREQNMAEVDLQMLQLAQPRIANELGKPVGDALLRLTESLALPDGMLETPSWWARRFAAMLLRCGWPGTGVLSSRELQVRSRFDELLGEFATCGDVTGRVDCATALELLQGWIQRAALEPASDDVPVTVTGALGNPLVRYDAIWVAGLTADAWPRAAAPDPLVPLPAQFAAGCEAASAAGRLQQARRAMQAWAQRCGQLVYSWSQLRDNAEMEPSPLLPMPGSSREAVPAPLLLELRRSARLEAAANVAAIAWPAARRLPGGARLFELQAECPFHACAQLRLRCDPLPGPQSGIDALARGQLLHRALEQFWRAVGDSTALQQRNASATLKLVNDCATRAVAEMAERLLQRPAARLLQIERERTVGLMLALLDVERQRSPFQIEALEWTQTRVIAGAPVQLRLDRLDRLDDGCVAVIDYKTGAPRTFDALAERSTHAQLLAYSLVAGSKVAAVATVHLTPRGIAWRGLADADGRLPLRQTAAALGIDWPTQVSAWQRQIEGLAVEFCAGHASVTPLPRACEHCHLRLLCRIEAGVVPDDAADIAND